MKNYIKIIILLFLFSILSLLFFRYPAPHERILNIQNYLITVGGIISAFIIAYLSAKIFNIKTDRENRQIQIDILAKRLTAFRRLLYFVMHSRDFWIKYDDIAKFKKEYPGLDYSRIRGDGNDHLRDKFFEQNNISHNTINLYLSMEEIYNSKDQQFVPWAYEKIYTEKYTIEDLSKYHEPCNQIWYYLDGRFPKHGVGRFNDEGLSMLFTENFKELLPIASIKQKGKDFHRLILSALGSEFYEIVIPEMALLINQNTGVPKGIIKTFIALICIMTFGVLLPIILQSTMVSIQIDTCLTLSLVILTTLSLVYFLLEFYDLLYDEIHTNK